MSHSISEPLRSSRKTIARARTSFSQDSIWPQLRVTQPGQREELFDGPHFRVWRLQGAASFAVGVPDEMRVLVCLEGFGTLEHDGTAYAMEKGAVMLLPAVVGACWLPPECHITLLDITVPDYP